MNDYVMEGVLGGGAMAVVYAARHRVLGTHHAIKVLSVDAPELRSRLRREAAIHTRLDHPNLVPVRDVIEVDEGPGAVMPLVRGPTLSALLAARPLEEGEGIALFRGIVAGVRHAHTAGVVHHDLKPGNVLLDLERGSVVPRVTDFGLQGAAGTPGYVAPEQRLDPEQAGPSADLYALGCVLYELLTGQRAFPDPLAVTRRNAAALPARWAALVDALLETDPAHRPSADQVLTELGEGSHLSALGPGSTLARDAAQVTPPLLVGRPPPRPEGGPPHNLEPEPNEFVGRDPELVALARQVQPGALVTLAGPAGVGKTRLARRFGRQALDGYPAGVWMCSLEGARTEAELVAALLSALELPPGIGARLEGALATFSGGLLLLDNLEQLEPQAVQRIGGLVEAAPQVAFLGTSREPLGLPVERRVEVVPLGPTDSVRLFVQRAQAAGAPLDLGEEATASTVGRIVQLLDGLPLALEIAAARVALISPHSLADQLSDQLDARHPGDGTTLRAALDASWALLQPWEQAAWAQLSVFEGGFTLQAADAVLSPEARSPEGWIERVVERLIRRSLVRLEEEGRYGMLVTVHAYARERLLDLGGGRAAEARHGAFFAQEGPLRERERANLVAAARRALRRGDDEVAAAAALGALRVLAEHGPFDTAVELGQAALAVAGEGAVHRRLLAATGRAMAMGEAVEPALEALQTALGEALRAGDSLVELEALYGSGTVEARRDAYRAEAHFERLRDRAAELQQPREQARALQALARLWIETRPPSHTEAVLEQAMALLEQAREPRSGEILLLLADCHLRRNACDKAMPLAQEALALAREQRDQVLEARAHTQIGEIDNRLDRWAEAATHHKAAIQLLRRAGSETSVLDPMHSLMRSLSEQGLFDETRAVGHEGLQIARRTGSSIAQGKLLISVGVTHSQEGRREEAIALYRAAIEAVEGKHQDMACVARSNIANLLLLLDRAPEARVEIETALAQLPANSSWRAHLMGVYACSFDHTPEERPKAVAMLERLIAEAEAAGRGDPGSLWALSNIHKREGRLAEARALAERAPPLEGRAYVKAEYLAWAGHLAALDGDLARAREALQQALQLVGEPTPGSQLATDIEAIRARLP
jgi:predicted ATPase/tetratricopeptide (TPR) repeat protein